MSTDLTTEKGRTDYLQEKFDNLLEVINDSYGQELLNELISRLETTIADFNEEVGELMNQLKENSTRKQQLLEAIIAGEAKVDTPTTEEPDNPEREEAMSAWERRLESLDQNS